MNAPIAVPSPADLSGTGLVWTPLSSAQQRLWFFSRLEADSRAYNIGGLLRFDGPLHEDVLQAALDQVLARHPALRTVFVEREGQPLQAVLPPMPLALERLDFPAGDEALREAARAFVARPYDLTRGPVLRIGLYRLGENRHGLVVAMHHIVSDAWSVRVLLEEMAEFYRAAQQGRAPFMTALPLTYPEYALQQRDWLAGDEGAKQLAYWRSQLSEPLPPLALPADFAREGQAAQRAAYRLLPLDAELVGGLKALAKSCGVTIFGVLLAALQLQLARLSGQPEVRIGVPVANRARGHERLVGFFVNTLVLGGRPRPQESVRDWLARVGAGVRDGQAHQALPFEQLVEDLAPARSLGQNPLFQVAFNYRRQHPLPADWLPGLVTQLEELPSSTIPFELALDAVRDTDNRLQINFAYAADLFSEASIERLIGGFVQLLQAFVAQPDCPLGQLQLIGPADQAQLEAWNRPRQSYEGAVLLPALIAAQARQRPQAIALVHGDQRLSYADLDEQANRLAQLLVSRGVGPDARVGLCLERGNAMIVGLLAILKAGGAFVPLDPDYPRERLAFMVEDSGLRWLLSSAELLPRLALPVAVEVLCLEALELSAYPASAPEVDLQPLHLAYLIYTSGSTGTPKGVAIDHAGLSMHVQTIGQRYGMTADDVELHFASISFDGALERWAVPLAFGSRLVIRDQALWSAEQTCAVLAKEGVTIACFPPSYMLQLLDWLEFEPSILAQLKVRSWTLGGEAFTRDTYERLQRVLKPQRIVNGYGPTETVVTPLIWEAFAGDRLDAAYAPIGDPVGPRRLYILDGELN
ncbi:MAG: condensation domain-containing protein, partial [Pseudomonas sp.]|uniref:condensation domain-containing protein n=1 Tax=Pseudomonas sp. TaxID=306 RepID=UPI003396BEC4